MLKWFHQLRLAIAFSIMPVGVKDQPMQAELSATTSNCSTSALRDGNWGKWGELAVLPSLKAPMDDELEGGDPVSPAPARGGGE
jgi:hypothetical protein